MWVSSTSTDGDIGGVNGATAICEMDASGIGGLAPGLTHRVVIGAASNDPKNYFSNDPPVQRPDRTVIANTYSDFFDPAVDAINAVSSSGVAAWTGLNTQGISGSAHCNNWTFNGYQNGAYGYLSSTNNARLNQGSNDPCNSSYRLICISY